MYLQRYIKFESDLSFEVTVIGDHTSGKSSLLKRFKGDGFTESYTKTNREEFVMKKTKISKFQQTVKLRLIEYVMGLDDQSRVKSLASDATILLFDITNKTSFQYIFKWINGSKFQDRINHVMVLVGTKSDLVDRAISFTQATLFADSLGIPYWEVSSKLGTSMNSMFEELQMNVILARRYSFMLGMGEKIEVTVQTLEKLVTMEKDDLDPSNKYFSFQRMMHKWKTQIMNRGVCYKIRRGDPDFIADENAVIATKIINIIFENIKEWDITIHCAKRKIFDRLISSAEGLEKFCDTPTDVISSIGMNDEVKEENEDASSLDFRLYAVAIGQVKEFKCDMDDILFDALIANSYPYKLWDKFSSNLINNTRLETFELSTTNKCMNDPLKVKKLADIFKCIAKSNNKLKVFILSINGDLQMNYSSHNDGVLRNVLYSSIIKCIKSNEDCIKEFKLIYKNNDSKFHLFDNKFCLQLMQMSFKHLQRMELDLSATTLNHNSLMAMYEMILNSGDLEDIEIDAKIDVGKFDVKNDQKMTQQLAKSTKNINLESLYIHGILPGTIGHCQSLLKLISMTEAEIDISFTEMGTLHNLYPLFDVYIDRFFTLYNIYRELDNYLKNPDNLPMFDAKVKTIISDYCRYLDVSMMLGLFEYAEIDDEVLQEMTQHEFYPMNQYCYDKIRTNIVDNELYKDIEEHASKNVLELQYEEIIGIFQDIGDEFAADFDLKFIEQRIVVDDAEEREMMQIVYEQHLDHSIIICGYLRSIAAYIDVYNIPQPLWILIYNFYPKYDVYFLCMNMGNTPFIEDQKKCLVSFRCDQPKLNIFDENKVFKTLNNEWYETDDYDECEKLDIGFKDIAENEKMIQYLLDKGVKYEKESTINFIHSFRRNTQRLCLVCINNADVILFHARFPKIRTAKMPESVFNANTFLVTDQNQHFIKDIVMSRGNPYYDDMHFLFLSSSGDIFTYGASKGGQCGVRRTSDDDDDITTPIHLETLSKKFITNVYAGDNFSLCLDKDKNLYCWGKNTFNSMALDRSRNDLNKNANDQEWIIWEPVLHDLFHNGDNGRIIKDISCGSNFVCFIDIEHQCYWSPPDQDGEDKGNNVNIVHFQSLHNQTYKDLLINVACFANDIDADDIECITLIDNEQRLICYTEQEEDISERLFIVDIPAIEPGDVILNAYDEGGFSNRKFMIFVKKKLKL